MFFGGGDAFLDWQKGMFMWYALSVPLVFCLMGVEKEEGDRFL